MELLENTNLLSRALEFMIAHHNVQLDEITESFQEDGPHTMDNYWLTNYPVLSHLIFLLELILLLLILASGKAREEPLGGRDYEWTRWSYQGGEGYATKIGSRANSNSIQVGLQKHDKRLKKLVSAIKKFRPCGIDKEKMLEEELINLRERS